MKLTSALCFCILLAACAEPGKQPAAKAGAPASGTLNQGRQHIPETYADTKQRIDRIRKSLAKRYLHANPQQRAALRPEITDAWIQGISRDLFQHWQGTPWDFNGITTAPKTGYIACGYFVTSMLQDMGVQLNRRKLSTCTSMQMMQSLAPGQRIRNLSTTDHGIFCRSVAGLAPGVYIIGLDFHTGLLMNDAAGSWFVHSNYIHSQGVIKEPVETSAALRASATKWVTSLTGDDGFITRWLTGGS